MPSSLATFIATLLLVHTFTPAFVPIIFEGSLPLRQVSTGDSPAISRSENYLIGKLCKAQSKFPLYWKVMWMHAPVSEIELVTGSLPVTDPKSTGCFQNRKNRQTADETLDCLKHFDTTRKFTALELQRTHIEDLPVR